MSNHRGHLPPAPGLKVPPRCFRVGLPLLESLMEPPHLLHWPVAERLLQEATHHRALRPCAQGPREAPAEPRASSLLIGGPLASQTLDPASGRHAA